jgi:predicted enzyme related to lactoylglutathione lyase
VDAPGGNANLVGYAFGMNFNNILIGSDNAPRLVEYYTKILGEPGFKDDSYTGWQIGSGSISIGPHSEVHGKNSAPGRIILNFESDDVMGDFTRMKDAGAIVIREPYSFDQFPDYWIATLADPDDNYFQLMTPFDPSMMEGQG